VTTPADQATTGTSADAAASWAFLALIVAQAAHSIEEHSFRLFDEFAPARLVSGLVSTIWASGSPWSTP
jgi:hypothetical protein